MAVPPAVSAVRGLSVLSAGAYSVGRRMSRRAPGGRRRRGGRRARLGGVLVRCGGGWPSALRRD